MSTLVSPPSAPVPTPTVAFTLAGQPYRTDPATFELMELCYLNRRIISGQALADFNWLIKTGLANGRVIPDE